MVQGKVSTYTVILVVIIVAALSMLFFENVSAFTGNAIERSTQSNVTIQAFFSIQLSDDLDEGIIFEDVVSLPVTEQNATHNYDKTLNSSGYWIEVAPDSNRAVDFCLRADGNLTSVDADTISLAGEVYTTNVTTSDIGTPDVTLANSMTTVYNKSAERVVAGDSNYYRFWVSIPSAQAPGSYTNNVDFKGVVSGTTDSTCTL